MENGARRAFACLYVFLLRLVVAKWDGLEGATSQRCAEGVGPSLLLTADVDGDPNRRLKRHDDISDETFSENHPRRAAETSIEPSFKKNVG